MAINRQDYQYVYNTLPSEKIPQDDGTLKVGAVVENLLPLLGDDTVYNPELDYYADRDSSRCWNIILSTSGYTQVTKEIASIEDDTYYWSKWESQPSHTIKRISNASYGYPSNAINLSYSISGNASCSLNEVSKTLTYGIWQESQGINESDDLRWITYGGGSVTASYSVPNSTAITSSDKDLVKQKGQLIHAIVLDNTKQYVIQVVNAYNSTEKNKIVLLDSNNKETSTKYEFDSYLCFSPKESGVYAFKINGISFGCKVYGLDGSKIVELRNYIAPSTAQVYLFESDKPWEVDINGTITNMKDVAGGSFNPTAASGVALTAEEVENMFFEAPIITATENQLTISIPNWSTVGGLYTTAAKPDTHKDLYLLTYRDCLTVENRRYNGTKLKVRRGLLRCIHKTMDINNIKLQEKIVFNKLTHPIITNGTHTISISDNMNDASNPELWPHLGRNYSYGNQNWKEDMDKYTSVCFALGVKDKSGDYKRISEFSRPVVVERNFDSYIISSIPNKEVEYNFNFISNEERFSKIAVVDEVLFYDDTDVSSSSMIKEEYQNITLTQDFNTLELEIQDFLRENAEKVEKTNRIFQENTLDENGNRTFNYYPQDSIYFIEK